MSADSVSFLDHTKQPADLELAGKCRSALAQRLERQPYKALPELFIDPLQPLPLADAAGGVVHFVYFIMASRPYGWETINRNVVALQRPGALDDTGANDTNVFLVHVDAKLGEARKRELRDVLIKPRLDVYMLRRPRPVLWAGWSMILALFDTMASVVRRGLHFEYFINLSDADLTLRTDTELRAFFARFYGRSVMSIVQKKKDPRRYKMHEGFRSYCWTECDNGSGFFVSGGEKHPAGFQPNSFDVIGKNKCCWSRTAPILYSNATLDCPNKELPEAYHGSQWASLHRGLVHHMVDHPFAQSVVRSLEHTLLPDEAMLQTIAINSPFRRTLIPVHLRFIEWPQSHGDANKYWASVGPQFHGGPMVLNATLGREKAFKQSGMFARKVDPGLYRDVLDEWDKWMDYKMLTGKLPDGQPEIAAAYIASDPELDKMIPPATTHDNGWPDAPLVMPIVTPRRGPWPAAARPSSPAAASVIPRVSGLMARLMHHADTAPSAAPVAAVSTNGLALAVAGGHAAFVDAHAAAHASHDAHGGHGGHDGHGHVEHGNGEHVKHAHEHEHEHARAHAGEDEDGDGDAGLHAGHTHAAVSSFAGGFLLLWVGCVVLAGAALLCHLFVHDSGVLACAREWLPRGLLRSRKESLHSAKMV